MHFPSTGALAGALFAGVSLASPANPLYLSSPRIGSSGLDARTTKAVNFDLDRFWNDETLFQGYVVPP